MKNTCLRRFAVPVFIFLGTVFTFSQSDYVPGMEKFPDIDVQHYSLTAEFQKTTSRVKARAVVVFEVRQAETDRVVFEMDRRIKISEVYNEKGNPLKFRRPKNSDSVTIHLLQPLRKNTRAKIEMVYICDFPLLKGKDSLSANQNGQDLFFWHPYIHNVCPNHRP